MDGGITLLGLPTLAGHTINVYLTSHDGGEDYYAGNTASSGFVFTGYNKDLVARLRIHRGRQDGDELAQNRP